MRKAREAKAKAVAETAERARAWAKYKDKEKEYIARLANKAMEKAESETRARKKSNASRRVAD